MSFTVWRPIPPNNNYVSLGDVVSNDPYGRPPNTSIVVCIPRVFAASYYGNIVNIASRMESAVSPINGFVYLAEICFFLFLDAVKKKSRALVLIIGIIFGNNLTQYILKIVRVMLIMMNVTKKQKN